MVHQPGGCGGGGVLTFLVSLRLISYRSSRRSASFLAAERRDIPGVSAAAAPPFFRAMSEPPLGDPARDQRTPLTLEDVPLLQLLCRWPLAQPPEDTQHG